eukprot:Blabericola_migrator_1__4289@NODE_2316_length_2947_cov_117_596528_g1452_i0_p3_GENE_NODE_2316_length_2947_cov_117_596528_g1452_i0NODE_2316_length_2947_cov_117_596528_g1452_i0_p3_ORF_typecomplete_len150_score27_78DUF3551/PF12071_8/0_084DUF3551/PF12071_8/4_7e02_NODE_2316_length_2947_cov_117_596528_g1452_i09351384
MPGAKAESSALLSATETAMTEPFCVHVNEAETLPLCEFHTLTQALEADTVALEKATGARVKRRVNKGCVTRAGSRLQLRVIVATAVAACLKTAAWSKKRTVSLALHWCVDTLLQLRGTMMGDARGEAEGKMSVAAAVIIMLYVEVCRES